MQLIMGIAAAALCTYMLRSGWRLLVEIPHARQVWVPDLVDGLLTRVLSALLMIESAVLLITLIQPLGSSSTPVQMFQLLTQG